MITQKSVFIIPGFRHKPTNIAYKRIAAMLKKQGYTPIPVTIPWKQTTISQNTEYFLKRYRKVNTKNKYILGFSFGAMIAFLAATKVKTAGLILCSLSPYFKEDMAKLRINKTSIRNQDFTTLNFSALAKLIKTKRILMLYGAKETKALINRVTNGFKQIASKQKYLIQIQKTEHDIGSIRYLQTLHLATKELL